jgi:hypothetical protein
MRGSKASGKSRIVAKLHPVQLLRICSMASSGMPALLDRHRLRRRDEGDGAEHVVGQFHDLRSPQPVPGMSQSYPPLKSDVISVGYAEFIVASLRATR